MLIVCYAEEDEFFFGIGIGRERSHCLPFSSQVEGYVYDNDDLVGIYESSFRIGSVSLLMGGYGLRHSGQTTTAQAPFSPSLRSLKKQQVVRLDASTASDGASIVPETRLVNGRRA